VPYVPLSHPFVERLIGTNRRECLDRTLFWTAADLETKLLDFQRYYNGHRTHAGLNGRTPESSADPAASARVSVRIDGSRTVVGCIRRRWRRDGCATDCGWVTSETRDVATSLMPPCAEPPSGPSLGHRVGPNHRDANSFRVFAAQLGIRQPQAHFGAGHPQPRCSGIGDSCRRRLSRLCRNLLNR
jgi:hypothetical protein